MEDLFKKFLYTGVGLVSLTAEKLQESVDELVGKGKISKDEGKKLIDDFLENADSKKDEFESKLKEVAENVVSSISVPSLKDFQALVDRIEVLEKKLGVEAEEKVAKTKKTTKRSTTTETKAKASPAKAKTAEKK